MKKFAVVVATLAMSVLSMSAGSSAAPGDPVAPASTSTNVPKPNTNSVSYWCPNGGVKFDNLTKKTFTVPAPAQGTTWTLAVVKAGSTDIGFGAGNDTPITNPVAGQVLSHTSGKNLSHVILCYKSGGGGHYPMGKPTVCASSSTVQQNKTFTVTAKGFCPNAAITITLSNSKNTYTKNTQTNSSGSATVTFNSGNLKPGTYTITARQNSATCKKVATSTVRILAKGGYGFVGDDADTAVGSAFAALGADMAANAQSASNAANLRASSAGVANGGAGSASGGSQPSSQQLMLAALLCVGGLGVVATMRRRSVRLATES